jgi:hypothetical protein
VTQGNQLADEAAKMATMKEYKKNPTLATITISGMLHPDYAKKGNRVGQTREGQPT